MADIGEFTRMGQIDPVHRFRIQGWRLLNFEETANLQFLPGFSTDVDHGSVHRSTQVYIRFCLYFTRCHTFYHPIRPFIFLYFHSFQRFPPMLRQPPDTVFRYLNLPQFQQCFLCFAKCQFGAILHR